MNDLQMHAHNPQPFTFVLFKKIPIPFKSKVSWTGTSARLKITNLTFLYSKALVFETLEFQDQCQYLGNCTPTPPLTQQVTMLG